MKRIIFSIYTNTVENHTSATDFKKSQFEKYKGELEESQKQYALLCGADYDLHLTNEKQYDTIQFDKLRRMEYFTQFYDEVVFLDFDVVPTTTKNIFDHFDLNNICAYAIDRTPDKDALMWALKRGSFDTMNMYAKTCAKNAMLLLDDINGTSSIINTGVVGGNKRSIELLNFSYYFEMMNSKISEAISDNLYPVEISRNWKRNNEVYITYLIERFNIPFTNIGLQWNLLIDKLCPTPTAAAYMWHHVNKEFELSYGEK